MGKDRNRVAPFYNRLCLCHRFQQSSTLDAKLHDPRSFPEPGYNREGQGIGNSRPLKRFMRLSLGLSKESAAPSRAGACLPVLAGKPGRNGHASRVRRSISRSSAIWPSCTFSSSTRLTPCITVVWSRPPKRRPISGSDRLVSCLHKYIATWRGRP